jgi:peptidoglycan/LPS O-acetylase OafA/YrhL
VPAYYLALALGLAFFGLLTSRAISDAVTPESVVAHLSFTQNEARLIPGYDGLLGFGVDPVVWTLSVEAAFYLLLPLVAVLWFRRPLAGLAGVIVAVTAARLALQGHDRTTDILLSSFPLHAVEFAAGMTAAYLTVRIARRTGPDAVRQAASWIAPLALVALALVLVAAGGPDAGAVREDAQRSVATMLAVPLLFAVLTGAAALAAPAVQWPLANPVSRWLGDVSYGVFLLHFMVIELAVHSLDFPHDGSGSAFVKLFAFAIPVTLALAWVSWILLERPIRRWARSAADVGREVAPDRGALVARGGHLDEG